jgi:hypothetical protein
MTASPRTVALCTTMYPGVKPYLSDWYASVSAQTDQDFDLWIGLDSLQPADVESALGARVKAVWVEAQPGATPADVRQQTLSQVVERYAAVILVDADDIMMASRVGAARAQLQHADVAGCAMQLVREDGTDLGVRFALPERATARGLLPRQNAYGLTNSAYRAETLAAALPIPSRTPLVDWYLSTGAWLDGATFDFDQRPRMQYRQHATAAASPLTPPFTRDQVVGAARLMVAHFESFLAIPRFQTTAGHGQLSLELSRAKTFLALANDDARMTAYLDGLNSINTPHIWWSIVAHHDLEETWNAN